MELPVENKNYAIRRIIVILILLVSLLTILLIKSYSQTLLYLTIIILAADFALSIRFLNKHNIPKINFFEDNLEIYHKGKKTIIAIDEIQAVHSGINDYIELSGKLSVMYRFDLKTRYKFGNQLYFKYNLNDIPDKEPKEMVIIKNRVKHRDE